MKIKPKFGCIGLGFIFERHLASIEAIGGEITVGCDIDPDKQYKLPNSAKFVADYKQMAEVADFDYIAVCAPNDLHDEIADFYREYRIIMEKPITINPEKYNWDRDNIYCMHQLRFLPEVMNLKAHVDINREARNPNVPIKAKITMEIRRDQWYFDSWKGDAKRSGGLAFNIGIHYFDLLCWLFGKPIGYKITGDNLHWLKADVEFREAQTELYLTLDAPMDKQKRLIEVNGKMINLNKIDQLHTEVYRQLINGYGIKPIQVENVYRLVEDITKAF